MSSKHLDRASVATMIITAMLFIIATFEKGLTHDLLLEAGVFLVSIKLVIATHKNERSARAIEAKLDAIAERLKKNG